MNERQRLQILRFAQQGMSGPWIVAELGLSAPTVARALRDSRNGVRFGREIARLTREGLSNAEIATTLGIARGTIYDARRAAKVLGIEMPPSKNPYPARGPTFRQVDAASRMLVRAGIVTRDEAERWLEDFGKRERVVRRERGPARG